MTDEDYKKASRYIHSLGFFDLWVKGVSSIGVDCIHPNSMKEYLIPWNLTKDKFTKN